jgi:ADP-ribose pyrophosphatase
VSETKGKVLNSQTMFEGPLFSVRRDRVIEPSGCEVTRDVVVHPGSVVLLPVFPDGKILMVRQYRHAAGCFLWELVAGGMEPGETPLAAARRELIEETGYRARRMQMLFDVFPTPGFVSEHMVVFACRDLKAGKAQPEEHEKLEVRRFTLRELERMMRTGQLRDTKSIASILYFARFHRR